MEVPVTKMEFAVRMTCQSCADDITRALKSHAGIQSVYADVANEFVLVDTTLPSSQVQDILEATGRLVVFRGYGGKQVEYKPEHHGAAVVAMQGSGGVSGLIRIVQVSQDQSVVEGAVDGLQPGLMHRLSVHEFGDLSSGCDSCGDEYCLTGAGIDGGGGGRVGEMVADETGRAVFRFSSGALKVWDVIGHSMVIHVTSATNRIGNDDVMPSATAVDDATVAMATSPSPSTSSRISCGIVAQSAGLFQNVKRVCTCEGVTIWEEAERRKDRDSENDIRAVL